MNFTAKPSALTISPDDPFGADCFDLNQYASALTDLARTASSPFVVNLEAPWGHGKTTFLEMWRHALRASKVQSLYFNAWETDFSADPLVALIGEISAEIASTNIKKSSSTAKNLAKLKRIGARVAARSVPALVKAATLGALDLSEVTEEAISTVAEKIAEDEIQKYEHSRESIKSFRAELEKFIQEMDGQKTEEKKPLVIIIDELDRCRPDYAIRVLETIKHFFAVKGAFFVVATDSRQLSNAIRHVYGLESAAEDYLRRFFDITLSLPKPSTKQFVERQFTRFGLDDFFHQRTHNELRYDKEAAIAAFVAMFDATGCSLRDQEKCFTLFSLSMRGVKENGYIHPLLLCALIVLKVKKNSIYEQFVRGEIDAAELVEILRESSSARDFFDADRGYGVITYAYLIAATRKTEKRQRLISDLKAVIGRDDGSEEVNRANRIVRIFSEHSFRNSVSAMRLVLPRIELFTRNGSENDWSDW